MRSRIQLLALGLVLLGLELSTRTVSLAVLRFSAGFRALRSGMEFHVSTGRFVTGVVVLIVGTVLLFTAMAITRTERQVARVGDRCPSCGGNTKRVKRKRFHRVLSTLMGQRLTRRECDDCHWVGLSLRF